ncbi:type VI secretion system contractile sheath large subunit [Acuticoccus sp. MNP-M23]|uniref:type VI secretion system contractile sheath large subunit n=1 Tax=Acuticoccus sp. MNP-M23 TaxID=3072793 RepID=UPI00281499EA|nr:type VI secretion system contractile sheath large subunit [Acuticoccus sp. MNP-M23]WMS44084.1 type VI secretion system contractile sheath large subunit [Acuticoccus sp. MNP-M23]
MSSTDTTQDSAAGTAREVDPDEFSDLLKQNFRPRTEQAASDVENAVTTLVAQALADTSLIKEDVLDTIEEMIAVIDKKLTDQVNEIMHAPEFQQIESAWRGLHHLVFNSETDSALQIKVLNISKNELNGMFKQYPGARWDQSPLFKQIYEQEFGQLGGHPYGALVGDYYFSQQPQDVAIMRSMAKIASAAHAPFMSGVDPNMLNMDSWRELANPRDLGKIFDTPEYAAWRGLRDETDTRYLGLCMPRVLSRLPYGAATDPVEEFAYEEETDGHDGEKYGWMNAAYAMAVNVNRAYKEYGWSTRIRGVKSGGEVLNLPIHTFPTDDGTDMKCPTEIAISDRREGELSAAGFLPIIHRKNTDKAAFIGGQSIYKPKKYDKPEATASDNLSARLPYIFATSRFAHYLKCMVRDQIGSSKERDELESWLQSWINRYVLTNPSIASEAQKAEKPLADASVKVVEDEENPGYYSARFYLRPHYQLEGMDIGLSLVSRLPTPT